MDTDRMRALLAVLQGTRNAGVPSVSYVAKSINCGLDVELANAFRIGINSKIGSEISSLCDGSGSADVILRRLADLRGICRFPRK